MTNPNPIPELLPCPFCGGEAERYTSSVGIGFENRQVQCSQCGASAFDAKWQVRAALSPQTLPAPGEVEQRFWLIVHKPGNVPERKGSWPLSELPKIMREFIAARPDSYLHVVTVDHYGAPDVQHGPESLQMADGRLMGVGRKHNARTLAAHTNSLATVAAANDEAFARGVEAAAKVAETKRYEATCHGSISEDHGRGIAAAIRLLSQGGGK